MHTTTQLALQSVHASAHAAQRTRNAGAEAWARQRMSSAAAVSRANAAYTLAGLAQAAFDRGEYEQCVACCAGARAIAAATVREAS